MKRDLYAEVSARIVAELEAGAAPWIKPWSASPGANTPCNALTNRPYSGCNVVLLWMAQAAGFHTPRYLTFKQALMAAEFPAYKKLSNLDKRLAIDDGCQVP